MDTPLTVTKVTASAFVAGWRDETGVTAIEYGLLASLITMACLVGMNATSTSVTAIFNYWSGAVIAAISG